MEQYDVIIIGAGPAGLRCAEMLQNSDFSVLVLEKKKEIGDKICAGGITNDFFRVYNLPDSLVHSKSDHSLLTINNRNIHYKHTKPFLFSISRKEFGQWQASRIQAPNVVIQTNTQVTKIKEHTIEVNHEKWIGFQYLVGADGPNSFVRKYLNLPFEKKMITLQYNIQSQENQNFEFHYHKRFFGVGGAYIFPHGSYYTVGCGSHAGTIHPRQLKINFHQWLKEMEIDPSNAPLESFPILHDYRGYQFGNIFLAGEAAGFSSSITGEGIYPALVSGEAIAELIQNEQSESARKKIAKLIRNNKVHERSFSRLTGIMGGILTIVGVKLLKFRFFQKLIWKYYP